MSYSPPIRIQPPAPSPDFPEPWRFSVAPGFTLRKATQCNHEVYAAGPVEWCPSCVHERLVTGLRTHAETLRRVAEASKVRR